MRYSKLFLVLSLAAMLFVSCKKDHFDTSNVHGVNAEGEMLLPVGKASFTLTKLMQQLKIDSVITCSEDGNLSYCFHYDDYGAVKGDELLRFKDLEYSQHFSYPNLIPETPFQTYDTMFHLEQTIVFESENIQVLEAEMRSGHFDITLNSNIGLVQRIVLHSSNIKDAEGHDMTLDFDFNSEDIQFDLDGLYYTTDTANILNLDYAIYVRLGSASEPELYFDVDVKGRDLALKEMSGYVNKYGSKSIIDTTMNLFPANITGALEVHGARLTLSERNTFLLRAQLDVDTAWIIGDDNVPYSIFGQQFLSVPIPPHNNFVQIYERALNGKISANETGIYTSSNFIVNPSGVSDLVSVADTCVIDMIIDTEIPFDFTVDDVRYYDTTNLALSGIKMPDQIEKLTLELSISSTLPLNMNAQFFTYDSETGKITDTLVAQDNLIRASFDGQPTLAEVALEITGEKVIRFMQSDRLISCYEIDTDAHNVMLKGQQGLDMFMKAKVKYNGNVEF